MIFPIGDDQVKNGFFPFVSYTFLIINVLVFFYEASLSTAELNEFIMHYGTSATKIVEGDYWSIFTSMFVHGGWMHLIGNMVFLWVFADNIEAVIGSLRFILFYFLGGIGAAMLQIIMDINSNIPMVGASGAIAAVLGAYLVMFPHSRVKVFVIFFFSSIRIPAILFLGFWIVQQIISGLSTLNTQSEIAQESSVAWWAHLGGVAVGFILGIYLKRKYLKPKHFNDYT